MNSSSSSIRTDVLPQLLEGTAVLPKFVRRLIVLISEMDFDSNELAQRIWQLSNSTHSSVLLLGLCPDPSEHLMFRRQLVTIAAAIRDNSVAVETLVIPSKNCDEDIKRVWQRGDLIVGLAEKRSKFLGQPLSEFLNSDSKMPVYVIADLHFTHNQKKSKLLSHVFLWLGMVGILTVFFWFQIQIDWLPNNWGQTTLLILSIIVEIIILWVWNSVVT